MYDKDEGVLLFEELLFTGYFKLYYRNAQKVYLIMNGLY